MSTAHTAEKTMVPGLTPDGGFWDTVEPGDKVRLQKPGWPPYDGCVDDRTADGDIVWVFSLGERRLFHRADGYSLVVRG